MRSLQSVFQNIDLKKYIKHFYLKLNKSFTFKIVAIVFLKINYFFFVQRHDNKLIV